ncbi:site-2 protease family protein [Pedococcus sp. 5OH_020]|uniref:site-2 protease family protein n=1 Tax=Pedococcus sp. 5OH_020 TaxID=2989814 RepID=UPI0022E9FCA3|nr:site-2 protease family protein [Pedococcus sp. 5OH_020]
MTTRARLQDGDEAGHGVRIARVAGIPVYVAPSWFLIAVVIIVLVAQPVLATRPLFGVAVGATQALLLLLSVLVHEAAHALTARSFGLPVIRIVANLWGGHTSMEVVRSSPGRMAMVALAGPAANGLLAALASLSTPSDGTLLARLLHGLVIINGSLAVLNVLPGMPLDGGQVVECLVWKATGDRNRGAVVAGWCGRLLALAVVAWFFLRPLARGGQVGFDQIWVLIIAGVLWTGATESIRRGRVLGAISRVTLGQVMRPASVVSAGTSVAEAVRQAQRELVVVGPSGHPDAYVDAQHLAAVPEEARGATSVAAVASRQHPGWVVDADPQGDVVAVLTALQRHGISLGAVVHGGRVVGVVHAADIGKALSRN